VTSPDRQIETTTLLPQMWLRKQWLMRALQNYPLYDPPHKIEERLMPREQAFENFLYFMDVRKQRVEHFRTWLRQRFWTPVQANERGVKALNSWAVRYSAFLLPAHPNGISYFSYNPPWMGDCAGCNVLFDMGISLGEFLIANCPNLRWDMNSISASRPKESNALRELVGTSFQRPEITGFDNPVWGKAPLHDVYVSARRMDMLSTANGRQKYRLLPRRFKRFRNDLFVSWFLGAIKEFYAGDQRVLYGIDEIPDD
jgi:hypothetical protein